MSAPPNGGIFVYGKWATNGRPYEMRGRGKSV